MIVQRFGGAVGAVAPDFRATAFNELQFVRRPGFSLAWAEFAATYERTGGLALDAETEGPVQIEVETELLKVLQRQIAEAEAALGADEVLLVESRAGHDYPRTHEHTEAIVEEGRNRLYFYYHIDPPLRLGVYRRRDPE